MSTKLLHITNGDTTTQFLKKTTIKGDIITWREMLCEGRTTTDVGSESFWKNRFDFLKTSYKVTKQTFVNYTLKEYRNLCKQKQQEEIVLWFEHDLYCQINMIAVLNWLKKHRKGRKISLVNCGKIKGSKKLHSFADLTNKQINKHYQAKIELTQDDIEYADYIWQLYCSDSPLRLEIIYKTNTNTPFIYLADALKAHLLRFPSLKNGLNIVENNIIKVANHQPLKSKEELVHSLLNNQKNYGFGDLQYIHRIDQLKNLFTSFNPIKLTSEGKKILLNQTNYYAQLRSENSYLGGSKKYSFLFNNETEKLLQITS